MVPVLALAFAMVACSGEPSPTPEAEARPGTTEAQQSPKSGRPSVIPKNPLPPTNHSLDDIIAADAPKTPLHWPRKLSTEMAFPQPRPSSDIPSGFSLVDAAGDDVSAGVFKALQDLSMFQIKKGKGERQLVVFSDPTSTYDHVLFNAISREGADFNATVHVLPLATGYHSKLSREITIALSCMPDPAQAWQDWARFSIEQPKTAGPVDEAKAWEAFYLDRPGVESCAVANALMRVFGAADQVGVDYTPTVVFANGQPWPGPVLARDDIEKMWWYLRSRQAQPQ